MSKTIKFTLLVLGIGMFVYGVSLIPLNASLNIFSIGTKTQNVINSYLMIGFGLIITVISFINKNIKS